MAKICCFDEGEKERLFESIRKNYSGIPEVFEITARGCRDNGLDVYVLYDSGEKHDFKLSMKVGDKQLIVHDEFPDVLTALREINYFFSNLSNNSSLSNKLSAEPIYLMGR